ncbi:MAG: hypothetical protein ACOX42_03285 [Clostridia bacterium]|jgi:hypothetical protein|nr:hypothetical protein [Clostridiales bacterium]
MEDTSFEKKLVIDSKRNVWLFYPMVSGKTGYVVKRGRGESAPGQPLTDETVTEYDIMVDERDNIHIVALTAGQRVVYICHDSRGWTKQTLYSFAGKTISIYGLKVMKDAVGLHLFYVYSEKGGGCALFHHQWTGGEWRGYRVFDVPGKEGRICYDCDMGRDNRLCIAAVEGKNLSLWDFDGANWTMSVARDSSAWENALYLECREGSIMIRNGAGVYFIRKARDKADVSPQEIIEGRHVDEGPVLINRRNTLYIAWTEGGSLGYRTSYDGGGSWGRVKYYHHAQGKQLEVYGFASTHSLLIDAKRVIATVPPEIHIPFLHRSVERIRMAEVSPGEPEERNADPHQDNGSFETSGEMHYEKSPVEDRDKYFGGGQEGTGGNAAMTKAHETDQSGYGAMAYQNDGYSQAEKVLDGPPYDDDKKQGSPLREGEGEGYCAVGKDQLERLKVDLNALRQRMEEDIIERLDRLDSEVANLKGKLIGSQREGTSPPMTGSIITQDMINRYFRKK